MTDMNIEMAESIAEERGYDRGFTAGTKHSHDLISQYVAWLKDKRTVIESDNLHGMEYDIMTCQKQINALEYAKRVIRTGHWDDDTELPW